MSIKILNLFYHTEKTTIIEIVNYNLTDIPIQIFKLINLQKLCLDNNLITEIVGLDHLTQLRWLDLSFNKIEVIKGLDKLKLLI